MGEFGGFYFVANNNSLMNKGDIQFPRKQKATKLDSVFLSFIQMIKAKLSVLHLLLLTLNKQQKMEALKNIQPVE
jgi:hypothetical protein